MFEMFHGHVTFLRSTYPRDEMVAASIRSKPEKVPTAIIDSSLSSACHGISAFYDQKNMCYCNLSYSIQRTCQCVHLVLFLMSTSTGIIW